MNDDTQPATTPRTDAEWRGAPPANFGGMMAMIDFARTLERELAASQAGRRDEESWWKEQHDYKERAEKAETDAAALRTERDALVKAGNALAEYLAPGPIPASEPTERDYLLADWEAARSSGGKGAT